MFSVLSRNIAALLALFVFVLGNGFFSTFISTVLTQHKVSSFEIGLMTTFFYGGLVLGAFHIERVIARVSHIRAYAAFASMLTFIALCHGIYENVYFWMLLRFLGGIATAGVFVVVESWLLCQSTFKTRGQILSLYMITFYASQSLGQLFLGLYNQNDLLMFVIVAMFSSLSVIPMAITRAETPNYTQAEPLSLRKILGRSASGFTGSFFAGLVMGAVYGLFPIYFTHQFSDTNSVAQLMFFIILGGMLLQYPIGKLSDIFERRLVLLITSMLTIAASFLMAAFESTYLSYLLLATLFGGLSFTLYPLSISYCCDALDTDEIVAGTQTLLLTYSVGAMLGPILGSVYMSYFSRWGLFFYFITALSTLCIILGWRKTVKPSIPQEETFYAFAQTSPVSCEADPRAEPAIDTSIENDHLINAQ